MPLPTLDDRLRVRDRAASPAVMYHSWRELLFVHWRVEPQRIQRTLPKGLYVDTFAGDAYVGIVPFFMRRIRPRFMPPLPWLSYFLELNVRTYVYDERGRPGVWFYSLDCNQPLAVWGARIGFHLPYRHASMSATRCDATIDYRSRVKRAPWRCDVSYSLARQGGPSQADSLEFFLVERYLLFAVNRRGRYFSGQVHHSPYEVVPAAISAWDSHLLAEHDFGVDESRPDHVCGSPGVDVEIMALATA